MAVDSKAVEVLRELELSFREMVEPWPTRVAARLEVRKKNGQYHVLGNAENSIEYRSLPDILQYLKHEVVRHLIQALPELIWLHAGAAAYRDRAVVFLGQWGRGKSTLVTSLFESRWRYLSDDIVPLNPNSGRVIPFPQTPAVRDDIGKEIPLCRVPELTRTRVPLKPEIVCREPMPIGALIFPNYTRQTPSAMNLCSRAPAVLGLLQNSLNFMNHRASAIRYLCDLVKRLPAFHLTFSSGKLAAKLITQSRENLQLV